jgi:hypothetical protein
MISKALNRSLLDLGESGPVPSQQENRKDLGHVWIGKSVPLMPSLCSGHVDIRVGRLNRHSVTTADMLQHYVHSVPGSDT